MSGQFSGFHEMQVDKCGSMQLRSYLGHCVFHNLFVLHIALVTHEQLVDAFGCVAVNFLKPLLDVVERVHVGHIVNDADAMGATVVGRSNRAETLLASRVPLERNACQLCPRRSQLRLLLLFIQSEASPSCHPVRWFGFSRKPQLVH